MRKTEERDKNDDKLRLKYGTIYWEGRQTRKLDLNQLNERNKKACRRGHRSRSKSSSWQRTGKGKKNVDFFAQEGQKV